MGSGVVAYLRRHVVEKDRVARCVVAGRRQRRLAPWPASLCRVEAIGKERKERRKQEVVLEILLESLLLKVNGLWAEENSPWWL
jgi:hypothetical protein